MKQFTQLNVFIASPGDVKEERQVVSEVCTEVNENPFCQRAGLFFNPTGWEDEFPAAGRPQEIINKLVDECNIFICLFYKRFGTPSGKEQSGTLEEFLRAYDSWKMLEKPHIMFYFKNVHLTPSLRRDPQFNEVMDLREHIEEGKILLFDTFDTADNFRNKFKKHLEKWAAEYVEKIAHLKDTATPNKSQILSSTLPASRHSVNSKGEERGRWDNNCDVLLLFVNDNERQGIYEAHQEIGLEEPFIEDGQHLTYHNFGEINGAKVLGLQTRMGSVTAGGAGVSTMAAIYEKKPEYIIAVGVAYGMNEKKQKIGNILVSQKVTSYEPRKIGVDEAGNKYEIKRGDTVSITPRIFNKFKAFSSYPYWNGAKVHFGDVLSGEKLIDDPDLKEKLRKEYPEAIGGEMEAAAIYSAAHQKELNWIVVKAVCDYADGKKSQSKKRRQKTAALNAARFVFYTLKQGNFKKEGVQVIETPTPIETEAEKRKPQPPQTPIRGKIEKNISDLLSSKTLKPLCNELLHVIQKVASKKVVAARTNLAKALVENELLESIFWMQSACTKCFNKLQDEGADSSSENRIWEDAVSIVGWLVLLSVDHDWAEDTRRALEKQKQRFRLEIPVKSDTGVEVVYSRITEDKADLCLGIQGEVTGRHIISRSPIEALETGWAPVDKIIFIKQVIWKEVFKGGKTPPNQFSFEDNRKLNTTIKLRSRTGKRYYLAVEVNKADNPLNNHEIYAALKKDLPDFQPIFIGIGKDSGVLVVDETDLGVYLSEFMSQKP